MLLTPENFLLLHALETGWPLEDMGWVFRDSGGWYILVHTPNGWVKLRKQPTTFRIESFASAQPSFYMGVTLPEGLQRDGLTYQDFLATTDNMAAVCGS